jgi:hypothetical protein
MKQGIVKFKKPLIANLDKISSYSTEIDDEEIYFHAEFLKPGRHTYIVRATNYDLDRNPDENWSVSEEAIEKHQSAIMKLFSKQSQSKITRKR